MVHQNVTLHQSEILSHQYDSTRGAHAVRLRLGFSLNGSKTPCTWEVTLALPLRESLRPRRLARVAERHARAFLDRYFAADDCRGENFFA